MNNKSIAIIIPYFGQWPEWIDLYIESCKYNPTIDWIFFSDCGPPQNKADNITIHHMSFNDYKQYISKKLEINFSCCQPYKLCDLKPSYGYIHEDILTNYDYYGFGDIDVIYGDIRQFYTEKVLTHNCISSHWDRVSGHLALFKNTELNRNAFRKIKNWQQLMGNENHFGIDESKLSKIYLRHKKYPDWLRKAYGFFSPYQKNCYFKEQYSTILTDKPWIDGTLDHPEVWFWKNGKLTNNKDADREFLYLHFMNWKSSMWLPEKHGNKAAWEDLSSINNVPLSQIKNGWSISPQGFLPL
ncbi:hypothetical protein H0A36_11260 [Endozoicomonas sp. SM1973]|uniref:Uncharacterized protein n=1 Tax=Spartinivicinus marinus TaxID=2994442 RepID=A0A853IAL0_9GAMM|nr:DUF6625 family protein [Spartinivicinus marinus]MCX4026104.1 hypothetical protein [Spartinivicinus marinus]NYZ66587.1 hypothetical protein [Spartinivicinus marinus]